MVNIDSLIPDIFALLEGKTIGDPKVLERFGPELGDVLTQRLISKSQERSPTLRMSNIGRPLRQLWYELNEYKGEPIDGKTHMKFLYGDILEALVMVLAEASGHKIERMQEEVSIDGILGHIDGTIDGVLVDVKSCSPYSFNKFQDSSLLTNDPFGYIGQLSGYAHALGLPARFIAIQKVLGDMCLLELPQQVIHGYDVRNRIKTVSTAIAGPDVPERCYEDEADGRSGNKKLSVGCSYCSYRFECWKDSNGGKGLQTYLYSTGPRYLTEVKRIPNVFNVNDKKEENSQ